MLAPLQKRLEVCFSPHIVDHQQDATLIQQSRKICLYFFRLIGHNVRVLKIQASN